MFAKLALAGTLALVLAPAAASACDFSDLACASGKCNIHFQNRTGLIENTCKKRNSSTLAMTVNVKALDVNDEKLGNRLSILAGDKNTMNLSNSKKQNTYRIRVTTPNHVDPSDMYCDEIRTILKGSGKCKIYFSKYDSNSQGEGHTGFLYFDCSSGDVCTERTETQ